MPESIGRLARRSRSSWIDVAFWGIVLLYLVLVAPLALHAIGDIRQVATFSPVSTDESRLMAMVQVNLQTGRFGAHGWYDYGGLYFALCLGAAYVAQAFTAMTEPAILAVSRLVSVLFGALSLWVVYLLGRKLFNRATALLAVAIMATGWVFVFWSAADHPDLPQMFFLTLALFGCILLIERPSLRWLAFAALGAALALSVKYTGAFVFPVILLADLLARWPKQPRAWLRLAAEGALAGLLFPIVFFVTTPYAWLNLGAFLSRMQYTFTLAAVGHGPVELPTAAWLGEIVSPRVLGASLALLVGVALLAFGGEILRRRRWDVRAGGRLIVIAWPVLYVAYLSARIGYHPPHYLLPVYPCLCLLAAWGGMALFTLKRAPAIVGWAARAGAVLLLAMAIVGRAGPVASFRQERLSFVLEDQPAIRAGAWLARTFPTDVRIGSDASANYIPPRFTRLAEETSFDADVLVVNRSAAGTFDSVADAEWFLPARDHFLKAYDFYRTILDDDRRPPGWVQVADFGSQIIFINAEAFVPGPASAQPTGGGLVFPGRSGGRDALYAFPLQAEEAIAAFEQTWAPHAVREDIRGLDGQPLAVAFRIRNSALPDPADPGAMLLKPPARTTDAQWSGGIELLGYAVLSNTVASDQALPVDLYWRTTDRVAEDFTVFAHALDAGRRAQGVGDRRPLDGRYPTNRWAPGDVIVDRVQIPLGPCAGAGPYYLELGLYQPATAGSAGSRLPLASPGGGDAVVLGPFELSPVGAVPADRIRTTWAMSATASADPVQLAGFDPDRDTAYPGGRVRVDLAWRAAAEVTATVPASLGLKAADGHAVELWRGEIGGGKVGRARGDWPAGQSVCHPVDLTLPADLPPGPYEWMLAARSELRSLGTIRLAERPGALSLPHPAASARVALGDQVLYLGRDPLPESVAPGSSLELGLYFQAQQAMADSYKVFVHLVSADGRIVAQQDGRPVGGDYATTDWRAGEVVRDPHVLTVPAEAQPGVCELRAGLYDEVTGRRLPVAGSDTGYVVVGRLDIAG